MIRHLVFVDFTGVPPARATEILAGLRPVADAIPGCLSYSWGENISPEGLNKGFTHAFTIDFRDEGARDAYLHAKSHQDYAKTVIFPALPRGADSVAVLDYLIKG